MTMLGRAANVRDTGPQVFPTTSRFVFGNGIYYYRLVGIHSDARYISRTIAIVLLLLIMASLHGKNVIEKIIIYGSNHERIAKMFTMLFIYNDYNI